MGFGIYIHIPYCIQKCRYCDFTTLPLNHKMGMERYADLILQEFQARHTLFVGRKVRSIYFGGGTPSLLPLQDMGRILAQIRSAGFDLSELEETTLEINPGTIDQNRLDQYLVLGINRFSVGVQTFSDQRLKLVGREHTVNATQSDLALLKKAGVAYSVDFLFGLPGQGLSEFQDDLAQFVAWDPPHLSAYNLTVPKGHPLDRQRAPDGDQALMFDLLSEALSKIGVHRYELSNYARTGFEGVHNSLYWNDAEYLGLGVSAHSYLKTEKSPNGVRFWNSPSLRLYQDQVERSTPSDPFVTLPKNQYEVLQDHEALTDFCHTQLRKVAGLSWAALEDKFGHDTRQRVEKRLSEVPDSGLFKQSENGFSLSNQGFKIANQMFLHFTFLKSDLM
jgi:oxygen-independent coproporphyrinogen III oxidase